MPHELLAAVDLGSNSFRLQVGKVVGDQIFPLDTLKESVRLAAGLTDDKMLDEPAMQRGIEALSRFRERLTGFAPEAVRAVGTNTLRVAKNAAEFLQRANVALGFPIEVIAGREEARLIYVGVTHTLPDPEHQQLVVDIGGGSTEFIIGNGYTPLQLDSLYMGCVSFSLRHFPGGKVDKNRFREAELAARQQIQTISHTFRKRGWERAVGSSGTAKALTEIHANLGLAQGGMTREGLEHLKKRLIAAGTVAKMELPGMRADREPVFPGGLAIMCAIFKEFGLEEMSFCEGALRQGVLFDLLGRQQHFDPREATVRAFMKRYQVDTRHAQAVMDTACQLLHDICPETADSWHPSQRFLRWAAALHEIGISVAHSGFHKHSAYIVANADMPGFSRMDQARLAALILAHRGKLSRALNVGVHGEDWNLLICLRLAALLHRARARNHGPLPVHLSRSEQGYMLHVPEAWLRRLPLTAAALEEEKRYWQGVPQRFEIDPLPAAVRPLAQ